MKSVAIEMVGLRFARLTVIDRAPVLAAHRKKAAWRCRCDCGRIVVVVGQHLRRGNTRSCGCYKSDTSRALHTTHQLCETIEYSSWASAKTRCYNPRPKGWVNYGGRGIRMCDAWRDSFETFLRDMGPCPPGHSIERLNNDGDYEPTNCVWAPRIVQANNRRNNHPLTLNGQTHTITEWERLKGFRPGTLKRRIQRGWSIARALARPVRALRPMRAR